MTLTVEKDGKIALPGEMLKRYGFSSETQIRIVETKDGILLTTLENERLSDELKAEREDWQNLSMMSWEMFPYIENEEKTL